MIIEYGSAAAGGCYHERSFNLACVFDGKGTAFFYNMQINKSKISD